jgi:ferritin-like metal-binding protein YciE
MSLNDLYDVYVAQLKDMYSAEKQLTEALPKMEQAASNSELKQAIHSHWQQTQNHMETVRMILDELNENPGNKVCKAMQGLVEEGSEVAKEKGKPDPKDAAIIAAAQKVEHYEISTYGSLRAFAKVLGYDQAAETLQGLLDQEYEADQLLDNIAEGSRQRASLNVAAR